MPQILMRRNQSFNTPHIAVLIATSIPILVILETKANMAILGDMYAFGLLGAFVFSSISLDTIRWRLGRRDFGFWLGVFTTAMVLLAGAINFGEKDLPTLFGGSVTIVGMLIAVGIKNGCFINVLNQIPAVGRIQARAYQASESAVAEGLKEVVSLADAVELKALYPSSTLLAVRGENSRLLQEGITRAKGKRESAIYCIYVEEWPGLFDGATPHQPNEEGIRTLTHALQEAHDKNIEIIPIWTISHNAADAIASAAKQLGADAVLVGATQRSALYHMLRGHVVSGLMSRLPRNCHLMICN